MNIRAILYMDDYEVKADETTSIRYTKNEPFVEVYIEGKLAELINIQVIRSMDVAPPPRKCKWCAATTEFTPCHKCNK
jgi:hypothetical protein